MENHMILLERWTETSEHKHYMVFEGQTQDHNFHIDESILRMIYNAKTDKIAIEVYDELEDIWINISPFILNNHIPNFNDVQNGYQTRLESRAV